jgi:AcrR family transcriptional regulator
MASGSFQPSLMDSDLVRVRWTHTRQEILVAARRVFARQGVHNTSFAQIAAELHVGRSALYYYFDSKEQLVEQAVAGLMEEYHVEFGPLHESLSTREAVRIVFDRYFQRFEQLGRDDLRFFYRTILEDADVPEVHRAYAFEANAFHEGVCRLLRRGQERKEIRTNIEIEEAAYEIVGSLIGTQFLWVMDPAYPLASLSGNFVNRWLARLESPGKPR